MKNARFVIIGGDAAGMSAAMAIRRSLNQASIRVFEQTSDFSYAQCGLPYVISRQIPSTDYLVARSQQEFQQKYNIDALDQHQVLSIDRHTKNLEVKNLKSGQVFMEPYDRLLIATGASPIIPKLPGSDLQGVVTFKTISDAHNLNRKLERAKSVVIIGGGFIGLELAEACRMREKTLTLIDLAPQVALNFDPELAAITQEELIRNGVNLLLNEEITEFRGDHCQVTSVITRNREIPADLVIIAIGVRPNSLLAENCGLELGLNKAIMVDHFLQTSDGSIWAAGDCAVHYNQIKKRSDYIPLGTTANKQGQLAGLNMAGEQRAFQGVLGTAILKVFDLGMARTGLSEREAIQLNVPYKTVSITANHHAGYYPGAEKLHIKLVYNSETQLLLGGQAVGEHGADKFIDILATALFNNMTINQLEDLDLSYAPPFSTVWAPIQQASRLSKKN